MINNNWESDEFTLKNELKLIDDSYYRVYDDHDYETWKERMLSIIGNQTKLIDCGNSNNCEESTDLNSQQAPKNESSINEINPIKPIILDLPSSIIYSGIEPKPPNIENYNMNISWGMKYLLGEIDQKCEESSQKNRFFKSMILESKPGKSKWTNSNRLGQDELYQGLEKVLIDLKSYTPYSIPFLVKVSKKDVPDYYNVIKKPMDLGTMSKKLKTHEYNNKQHFLDDLNLIFSNCFMYNTAEDSIYRQHIQMLRDKWTYLLKSVPDIVVGKGVLNGNGTFDKKIISALKEHKFNTEVITAQQQPFKQVQEVKQQKQLSDPMDDLDDLLNAHLDSLSDSESCPSPKKLRKTSESSDSPTIRTASQRSFFAELSSNFPGRCEKLMMKYSSDFKESKQFKKLQQGTSNPENGSSSFVFPELVYFFNTIPDSHLIRSGKDVNCDSKPSYSPVASMNKFYDNFRILQSIRSLRKHLLEGSRAEVPSIEHLKIPSRRFDRLEPVFDEKIEVAIQAKTVLRKVITLYLAQAGFELISNSALHAFYEIVDANFTKLFSCLRLLNEEFGRDKDSADILRLALLQMDLKHLSDLDVTMSEPSYAKGRLEHLLSVMCLKVDEYQLSIRGEQGNDSEDNTEDTSDEADEDSGNELDENCRNDRENEDEGDNEQSDQEIDDEGEEDQDQDLESENDQTDEE